MSKNPYPVGPGWWHLLDLEIPYLFKIDPGLTGLEITEKYGFCQVDCWPSEAHKHHADLMADVASTIESQSATICENCGGNTRVKPTPETPYCERCFNLPTAERFAVRERTKERYFHNKGWWECPVCGVKYRNEIADRYNFCPNCGNELGESTAKPTLEDRLEKFYKKPIEEIDRIETPEYDWGKE